jgi:hypothetical protein
VLAKFAIELLRVVFKGDGSSFSDCWVDEEGDGFEAASIRLRASQNPNRDTDATESIGLDLTYSFQSTKRFASTWRSIA